MSTRRFATRRLCPMLLAVVMAGLATTAAAGPGGAAGAPAERRTGDAGRVDSRALSDAVRRVERATGGEVLSAERVPFDGRDVSRVKVVDASGRVRVYMDDPQRGRARPDPARTRGNDGNSD